MGNIVKTDNNENITKINYISHKVAYTSGQFFEKKNKDRHPIFFWQINYHQVDQMHK